MGNKFLKWLEIPVEERETLSVLKNPDLSPIPVADQQWGFFSNFGYWGIISFGVGTWISAASTLELGLSVGESIGSFIIGDIVTILFTLANSYQGTTWKVGYTMSCRFTFGIYGSGFGILVRILMSIVNYGSNAWLGALSINLIISSWSKHYLNLPNTLSHHVAMSTKELIGFVLFHLVCGMFYIMKPSKMNRVLIVGSFSCGISMLCMVIYLTSKAHGAGHLFSQPTTITGSKRAWAWVYLISYWFGSVSPGSINQSDYSRFASSRMAVYTGTTLALLIPTTIIPIFGVIGASTSKQLYGQQIWMPTDLCDYWLNMSYSPGARAAVFFIGVTFTASQIAYTISTCGFAAGMDLTGLAPKYINVTRGSVLCAIVSVAVQPWNFYNSTSNFLTVMSSFGVVMTPIISVMICDNLIIHKNKQSVSEAFKVHGMYYYNYGVNWKAMVATICGIVPGIPGMAWQVNNNYFNNPGIVHFYYADSFTGFLISFFLYLILSLIWKDTFPIEHDDKDWYGAFTDEEARAKGMIPFSELSKQELHEYHAKFNDDSTLAESAIVGPEEKFGTEEEDATSVTNEVRTQV